MSKKYVYKFSEGNAKMRELLGGKGANLAEMTNIGLPVPQGFTITTEACTQYYEDGRQINDAIMAEVMENVRRLYIGERELAVESARVQKGFLLCRLRGVDDLNAAMALKGRTVSIAREDAKLAPGEFFHKVGLDYVSCSPFRVPIARLAAAQAAIKEQQSVEAQAKAAEAEVEAKVAFVLI